MEDELALLITVVLAAESDQPAREACGQLVRRIDGRIVQSGDCSDEEPGCWSVSISRVNGTRAARTDTRALAETVRGFVHQLGPGFARQRVACDPPAAWTVVDDPELVGQLVPGGERMLVEAWAGTELFPVEHFPIEHSPVEHSPVEHRPVAHRPVAHRPAENSPVEHRPVESSPAENGTGEHRPGGSGLEGTLGPRAAESGRAEGRPLNGSSAATEDADSTDPAAHLQLWVDVLTDRAAGAEWQARAVASRVTRAAEITEVIDHHDGLVTVGLDLGPALSSPAQAVLDAMSGIGRSGWTPLEWEGASAVTRWVAEPRPETGIAALELTAGAQDADLAD